MKTTPISFKNFPTLLELKSSYPGVKALFFDMDGTLFNTESYHESAFLMMGAKHKIRPPHSPEIIHELLMGKADHLVYDIVKYWEGFPPTWSAKDFVDEKNKNLLEILTQKDPNHFFHPDMLTFVQRAREEKFYLALVTSSERIITEELLKIAGIRDFFQLILTRDDCPTHKPDPWPYLKAMEVSGHEKHEVMIFEDSQVGLLSATNSGAHVIRAQWYES